MSTPATRTGNPVRALQRHVDSLAESITGMPPAAGRADAAERRRQVAATWVYLSTVVAWAEDHGLVDVWLRKGLRGMPGRFTATPGPVVCLAQTFGGLPEAFAEFGPRRFVAAGHRSEVRGLAEGFPSPPVPLHVEVTFTVDARRTGEIGRSAA